MFGTLHPVVRHLAFDDAGVGAVASLSEGLEEKLQGRLAVCVVKHVRGKNPDGTPRCGAPPGECG